MMQPVSPWRVLAKGASLFLAAEFAFYAMQPDLAQFNAYRSPAVKRLRFPASRAAPTDAALDLENLDEMFASHIVSEPKAPAEYRVFILGDSSTWGALLPVQQTLGARLNDLHLTCGGRNVQFYDLSFPGSSVTKDLMILDKGMPYQPDLIIWALTLYTVMPKARVQHVLIQHNPDELNRLQARFRFLPKTYPAQSTWQKLEARQAALFHILRYDLFGLVTAATGVDQMISAEPEIVPLTLTRDLAFQGMPPPIVHGGELAMDEIAFGYRIAHGVPLLLFNEPMLIEDNVPNSDVQYNAYYPRWVYDQYREILGQTAAQNGWNYLDLWDRFPANAFTNTPLHMKPEAEVQLAGILSAAVDRQCP